MPFGQNKMEIFYLLTVYFVKDLRDDRRRKKTNTKEQMNIIDDDKYIQC